MVVDARTLVAVCKWQDLDPCYACSVSAYLVIMALAADGLQLFYLW